MHLAVAVGSPTLALFTGMDLERWGHAFAPHHMLDLTGATVDESILFKFGETTFANEAGPIFDVIKPAFDKARGQVIIEGHTDSRGTADVLLKLSQERVATVQEYLVSHGIGKHRITGRGYGATRPVATGDSEEDRRLNRRVEFKITKK